MTARGVSPLRSSWTESTSYSGTLPDQAAPHGMLLQIIRLGPILLSLDASEGAGGEKTGERP
jgi:hypothetical protein